MAQMTEFKVQAGQYTTNVRAIQWPESWEKQAEIAKYLGTSGISFQFENGQTEPGHNQYIPQLYLFTHRYDRVNVRIGDWILLKELPGRFTVMPRDEFMLDFTMEGE